MLRWVVLLAILLILLSFTPSTVGQSVHLPPKH